MPRSHRGGTWNGCIRGVLLTTCLAKTSPDDTVEEKSKLSLENCLHLAHKVADYKTRTMMHEQIARLQLTRPLHHFYQNLSGLDRSAHFAQECNASTTHAVLGFQAHMKAEAVDRCHRSFLRLHASERSSK